MAEERWIVIPNWRRFQHYRDRQPKWIKVYTELLDDPNWRGLPMFHRGLLAGIWLLYAASRGQVPASPAYLASELGLSTEHAHRWRVSGESVVSHGRDSHPDPGERPVRLRDLKRLEQAGFITIAASRPLALASTPASPEVEVLRTSTSEAASAGARQGGSRTRPENKAGGLLDMNELGRVKCPECGLERKTAKQLAEHVYISHDGPEPDHWIEAEQLAERKEQR